MTALTSSSPQPGSSAMQDWLHPPQRPEQISQLIAGVERYDPAQVQVLEDYLAHQLRTGQYDPLANLATLKLYQFNPDLVPLASESPSTPTEAIHDSITLKILLLSIAQRPFDSDFSLALALCGDRMSALVTPQDTLSAFAGLSRLSFLLQSRQFAAFWTLLRSDSLSILQPFVAEVADFDDLIRASVGNSVEGCFRSIGRRRLETYLGMEVEDRDLDDWLDQRGWTSDGDKVVIPPNAENSPVASVIRERTSLDDVQKILVKSLA